VNLLWDWQEDMQNIHNLENTGGLAAQNKSKQVLHLLHRMSLTPKYNYSEYNQVVVVGLGLGYHQSMCICIPRCSRMLAMALVLVVFPPAQKQSHSSFWFFLCSCFNQKFNLITSKDIFYLLLLLL
jgi:hypothetical protein